MRIVTYFQCSISGACPLVRKINAANTTHIAVITMETIFIRDIVFASIILKKFFIGFSVLIKVKLAYFFKTIRNVVALPGSDDLSEIFPRWYISIIRFESDSPSPHPLFLVVKPGWKMVLNFDF